MLNENMAREVREARAAGQRALESLRDAKACLDSARNWGFLDMFGGGLLTTMIKHSKIGDAQHRVEQAQRDLEIFRRELRDVQLPYVQIDDFLTFSDFFFDGFLADFLVQRKINESRERLDEACRKVEDILHMLPPA